MKNNLIAIYGGSFNPPTFAHENIARDILTLKSIDKLIYLPVGNTYKKDTLIEAKYRYGMLNIIVDKLKADNLKVELNDLEIKFNKRLYTLESLRILKREYKSNLAFVMGTDNVKEFDTWYNPRELLEEFHFIVIERDNDDVESLIKENNLLRKYQNRFIIVKETSYKAISSTYIRNNIYNDLKIEKYIDVSVLNYIKSHNLYKGGSHL